MNALFRQLKQDHKEVKALLNEIDETTPRAVKKRQELILKLKENLIPHARAEEKVLYGHMREEDRELQVAALEGHLEHKVVDVLIPELLELEPSTPLWQAKFMVLKEALEHHIKEEENEFFKKCEKNMDADYDALLVEFINLKEAVMATLPSQEAFGMTPEQVTDHGMPMGHEAGGMSAANHPQ